MDTHGNSELHGSPFRERKGATAIILAGGLGTRLRSVVSDIPKCMAPVAGNPFLYYVIEHLKSQGIDNFIFSLGYKHAMIEAWLKKVYPGLYIQLAIEEEPLGTGGAVKLACSLATQKNILLVNGDTLFKLDIRKLLNFHDNHGADCTVSLKPMQNFNRYGVVEINKDHSIISFKEKQEYAAGLINAGVYALTVADFLNEALPQKFSFETGYLESLYAQRKMFGVVQDEYFIDIGIPEDYERAGRDLAVKH